MADYDDYEIAGSWGYICPYCKHEGHWNGDPIGDDGDSTECDCEECGKEFEIVVSISVDHNCYPKEESLPNLNNTKVEDGEHN